MAWEKKWLCRSTTMVTHCVRRNTKGRELCAFLLWKEIYYYLDRSGWPLSAVAMANLFTPTDCTTHLSGDLRLLGLWSWSLPFPAKREDIVKDQPGHQTPAAVSSPVHHCQNTHCCGPTTLTRPRVFQLVINSAEMQCSVPITRTINTWYAPGLSEHKQAVILSIFFQFVRLWL